MRIRKSGFVAGLCGLALVALGAWWWARSTAPVRATLVEAPGWNAVPAAAGDRATLISGRRVTPAGRVVRTQSYSWGMAVAPDESRLALIRSDAIELVPLRGADSIVRLPPYGVKPPEEMGEGTYMGVAFSADGERLYVGSANSGEIKEIGLASGRVVRTFSIDGGGFQDSFVGDFVLDPAGTRIYALDQFNHRWVAIDAASGSVLKSVRVGRNPFSVSLSPDGRQAWVTNVGMFEYPLLPGVTEDNRETA
ncbi:MAG: YncE family protein, partial [Rhodospirillaceae bacterium]